MCVCSEDRTELMDFRTSFVALLQVLFKKEKKNPYKAMMEAAICVVRMDFFSPGDDTEQDEALGTRWFHIAYVNQRSWCVCLTEVYRDPDYENTRIATAVGHVALRAAPSGDALDESVHDPDQPFDAWRNDNCPRRFHSIDFSHQIVASIYEIADGDREMTDFVPACIEVAACPRPPCKLWPLPCARTDTAVKGSSGGRASSRNATRADAGLSD